MKNAALLTIIKITTVPLGFFGALSLVRSMSTAFNWYARWVYGDWFNFRFVMSAVWLLVCLGSFSYAVWYTKPLKAQIPHRRVDYSLLVLICSFVFTVAMHMLILQGWRFGIPTSMTLPAAMTMFPIIAYALAVFALGELLARLRDKTLVATLYWLAFFKNYPIWRPIGFFAFLFLASQLFLIMYSFYAPVWAFWLFRFSRRLFEPSWMFSLISLLALSVSTYFATFLLNLAKNYEIINAEKIRAERFKSELITNVSHDIKTPLTSIINYVDLLKKEVVQGKPYEYVQVLDQKSARLKTLIDDLMEASKAGTGNVRVDMQKINLIELLGQVAGEFEDSFAARGLTLVTRQPEMPIIVSTDNRHLYRVLENLFSNAAKYALGGTRVFADIALYNDRPHIVVQNTSESPVGLQDGEATEQFMRGDKSRQTEGSGLGLYIAKSLVELIGGQLAISISGDLFRVDVYL